MNNRSFPSSTEAAVADLVNPAGSTKTDVHDSIMNNRKPVVYAGPPVTETILNGFFTVDQKWNVTHWNKAAEKIMGVSAQEMIGKNIWEKFAGIIPLNFYTVYHKAFLQDIPLHFTEYWAEKGAWFDVVTYHCDDSLSVSFKDVNQSRPAQPPQQMAILNELYRFVTEVTNDCLWEMDFQAGEIFWIDGSHKRVFGYHIENALISVGFWESLIHPDDRERIIASLNEAKRTGGSSLWEVEYRFKKADGSYANVHDCGHIIYNDERTATRMIGATQDISRRVTLENKLAQESLSRQRAINDAVLAAQEKERLGILQELHENLNQLLSVAKWHIDMAKRGDRDISYGQISLSKAGGFIVDVIEGMREISRKLAKPGLLGLFDMINSQLNEFMKKSKVEMTLIANVREEDLSEQMRLDIFRIVQEQLDNILKHAGATSGLINLDRHGNDILLNISDNGKGYSTEQGTKGVGIMNISSRVELKGGTVRIKSEPGAGYELNVVLPLVPVYDILD